MAVEFPDDELGKIQKSISSFEDDLPELKESDFKMSLEKELSLIALIGEIDNLKNIEEMRNLFKQFVRLYFAEKVVLTNIMKKD